MGFFSRKIECEKFFTYKTNSLNISGLSAGLSGEQVSGFDLKVGQFELDPKFVEASEKLKQLDMLQYSTCQTIRSISLEEKRDELLIKLAELKMQMLFIAQNPEKASEIVTSKTNDKNKPILNTTIYQDDKIEKTIKTVSPYSSIRIEQLSEKIKKQYFLLNEWEDKKDLSDNPKEKERCKIEIQSIKKIIDDYSIQLNKLEIDDNNSNNQDCRYLILDKGFGICEIKQAPEKYIDIETSIKDTFVKLWTERKDGNKNSIPPSTPNNCAFYNFLHTECSECPQFNQNTKKFTNL